MTHLPQSPQRLAHKIACILLFCLIPLSCRKAPQNPETTYSPVPTPLPYEDVILYTSQGEFCLTNLAGDQTERISEAGKSNWFPAVSPDHQSVAFWSNLSGFYEIWLYDFRTKRTRQLTFFNEPISQSDFQNFNVHNAPSWSPNSLRLIFSRSGQLWSVDANGFNLETLIPEGENYAPAVSPDGKWLAYISASNNARSLYLYDLATAESWELTRFPSTQRIGSPAWSPNNNQIAFTVYSSEKVDIWTIAKDGSQLKRLTMDGYSNSPAWSLDGQKIAFTSGRQDPYHWEIWAMNQDGSGQFSITRNGGFAPCWYRRPLGAESASLPFFPKSTPASPTALPTAVPVKTAKTAPMVAATAAPVKTIQATAVVQTIFKPTLAPTRQPTARPTLPPTAVITVAKTLPTPKPAPTKIKPAAVEELIDEDNFGKKPTPNLNRTQPTPVKEDYAKYEEYADADKKVLPANLVTPEVKGNHILFSPKIEFYFAKDLIKPNSLDTLKKLTEELNKYSDAPLVVKGYRRGPGLVKAVLPILNSLSRARANSVLRHLIVNEKIRQINVSAIGENDPFPELGESADRPVILVEIK